MIFNSLYDWAKRVVKRVPVIQSHQDAPAPQGHYIVIDYAPISRTFGTVSRGEVEHWRRSLKNDLRLEVGIWEVGGTGLLEELRASLDKCWALDGITVFKAGDIVPSPRLAGEEWIKESRMSLFLGVARETFERKATLENVELTMETP